MLKWNDEKLPAAAITIFLNFFFQNQNKLLNKSFKMFSFFIRLYDESCKDIVVFIEFGCIIITCLKDKPKLRHEKFDAYLMQFCVFCNFI